MNKLLLITACILFCSCRKEPTSQQQDTAPPPSMNSLASEINQTFIKMRETAEFLKDKGYLFYSSRQKYDKGLLDNKRYSFFDNITYHTPKNDGHAAIFASGIVPITDKQKTTVKLLENFEPHFAKVTDDFAPLEVNPYYSDHESVLIAWPWFDVMAYLPPKLDIPKAWVTYWMADAKHNPKRETIWTPLYLDAAGEGFMTTVSTPLYLNNQLEGVVSIDITASTLSDNFLNSDPRPLLLIASDSTLVAANPTSEIISKFKDMEKFNYLKTEAINEPSPEHLKLKNNKDSSIQKLAEKVKTDKEFLWEYAGKRYIVHTSFIDEVKWYLVHLQLRGSNDI